MDDGTRYSIGKLAKRTGLTVKTIRFYSDRGIVPPAGRSPAGYRRYATDAVARLALVQTLRELGLGLDAIRRVIDCELPLADAPRSTPPLSRDRCGSCGCEGRC